MKIYCKKRRSFKTILTCIRQEDSHFPSRNPEFYRTAVSHYPSRAFLEHKIVSRMKMTHAKFILCVSSVRMSIADMKAYI